MNDSELATAVLSLEIKNTEAIQSRPSILITNENDSRIEDIISTYPFLIQLENAKAKTTFVVINPDKYSGILFWKKKLRIQLTKSELENIKRGDSSFSDSQRAFLLQLKFN